MRNCFQYMEVNLFFNTSNWLNIHQFQVLKKKSSVFILYIRVFSFFSLNNEKQIRLTKTNESWYWWKVLNACNFWQRSKRWTLIYMFSGNSNITKYLTTAAQAEWTHSLRSPDTGTEPKVPPPATTRDLCPGSSLLGCLGVQRSSEQALELSNLT